MLDILLFCKTFLGHDITFTIASLTNCLAYNPCLLYLIYSIYMYIKKYMILIGQTKSLVMMTQKSHRAFSWFVLERQA